ncbi:MAG: phosphotransferase family protein [Hyphomicrobiaceae bacterium]|uniref:phosphotransferase family protein n=1 Tax=Pseudorhodoplanes sp. TaxID=1934341 RepID=UPI003D0C97CD
MMPSDAHVFRAPIDAFPINRERLGGYLQSVGLPLDPAEPILQFGTGLANINYRLRAGGRMLVLRRPPDGDLPPGAHDMAREHRILSRLWRALPLAPQSVHLCEDRGVIGVNFQLIDYRPGLVIKGDDKRHFEGKPEVAARTGKMLVETLVAIHGVDADSVGLGDLGKPDGFIERARKGWMGRAERLELAPAAKMLVREISGWLERQTILARSPTLLHSDFKLDNLIVEPGALKPVAIVDWDMGTRGDPLFDVATMLSYWVQDGDPDCMHDMRQLPTASPGFPTRSEIVAEYARLTGRDVSDFPILRVLAMFKLAVVLLQLHALWKRGAAKGDDYAAFDRIATDLLAFSKDASAGRG